MRQEPPGVEKSPNKRDQRSSQSRFDNCDPFREKAAQEAAAEVCDRFHDDEKREADSEREDSEKTKDCAQEELHDEENTDAEQYPFPMEKCPRHALMVVGRNLLVNREGPAARGLRDSVGDGILRRPKMNAILPLVPIPVRIDLGEGSFPIASALDLVAVDTAREAAEYLSRMLERGAGIAARCIFLESSALRTGDAAVDKAEAITRVRFVPLESLGTETDSCEGAYRLRIDRGEILIEAGSAAGYFWATQTLRQLLPPEVERVEQERPSRLEGAIPCVLPAMQIEDRPRFRWRGLHFDVSRHFFPVDFVKRLIDVLALYKMNTFHWHLTDDQGWRIEIKRYPELTEVGAWRRERDGSRQGGFYTQQEIRAIVAYAAERQVRIIPEIEMPGHARSAIAAYPWLSCSKQLLDVWNQWGISKELLCPGREETFELIEGVLDEVAELFPGELVHIGGDECPKDRWKVCPDCQARIREEGLADEEELQAYFVRRIQGHLSRLGKKIAGWDEIVEGELAPGATVMSWRGVDGGVAAVRAGHSAVMSPTSHCYFDYRQSTNRGELGPTHFDPPVTTLRKVYSFDPVPEELSDEEARHIIGSQANVWTEDIDTCARAGYMIFPRLCALAEVLWSRSESRSWASFKGRLVSNVKRLDALSVEYCRIIESIE